MTERGRFIVVEGLEGAGKSTAIKTIDQCLQANNIRFELTREPGGTRIGETIRTLIKEKIDGEVLDARAELLLLYAARVQLVEQVIRPALNKGLWILGDRFELSTYAYQGGGRGIDRQTIADLSKFCLDGFKPDLIFFLDIDPAPGLERARSRGELDRIEQEPGLFFKRVYDQYHAMIKTMDNVICIDASLPLEQVQELILTKLSYYLSHDKII